jgi:hypothetical protein
VAAVAAAATEFSQGTELSPACLVGPQEKATVHCPVAFFMPAPAQ